MSDNEYNKNSYDAVLARIDEKLDNIQTNLGEIKGSHESMAARVSKLENFRYYLLGSIAVISFGFNYIVSKFKGES
jgi:hypothetical protein